jgi:hypothetical protein
MNHVLLRRLSDVKHIRKFWLQVLHCWVHFCILSVLRNMPEEPQDMEVPVVAVEDSDVAVAEEPRELLALPWAQARQPSPVSPPLAAPLTFYRGRPLSFAEFTLLAEFLNKSPWVVVESRSSPGFFCRRNVLTGEVLPLNFNDPAPPFNDPAPP